MDIKKTMQNLDKNGIKPYFVEKKEDVVPLVKTLINKGESVSCGGSVTLDETGVKALMQNGDYDFIDRSGLEGEQLRNAYIKTFGCDTFFTSSNAVTENISTKNVIEKGNNLNLKIAMLENMDVLKWLENNIPNKTNRAEIIAKLIGGSPITIEDYLDGKNPIKNDVKQNAIDFINQKKYNSI